MLGQHFFPHWLVPRLRKTALNLLKNSQIRSRVLISVPFQGIYDCCIGPNNVGRWTLNIQPVVPIALNSDWNVVVRTIMPIVSVPAPSSTNALLESGSAVSENAAVNSIAAPTGLGDTLQSFFFSPQRPGPSGIVWGVGPAFLYPTATNAALGAQRWGVGPTVVVLKTTVGMDLRILSNHNPIVCSATWLSLPEIPLRAHIYSRSLDTRPRVGSRQQ